MLGWSRSAEGLRAPFPRYWLSDFLANFGDGVRLAAFPLLAVHFTRSPTAVAAVTAVQGLPWLVLGAGAGVIVDRTDRRRVMVTMSIVQAVMIAALAVAILVHSAGLFADLPDGVRDRDRRGAARYRRLRLRATAGRGG